MILRGFHMITGTGGTDVEVLKEDMYGTIIKYGNNIRKSLNITLKPHLLAGDLGEPVQTNDNHRVYCKYIPHQVIEITDPTPDDYLCQKTVICEDYSNLVQPKPVPQWLLNIFNYSAETIIEETDDHVVVMDYKEDGHFLIFAKDQNLRSIRDLRSCHIPILNRFKVTAERLIPSGYGFFHYLPSVWQLHLHVKARMDNTYVAHHIDVVIRNLELLDTYYANAKMLILR
jgi:hypothetical protein